MPNHDLDDIELACSRRPSNGIAAKLDLALECWMSLDSNQDGKLTKSELNAAANNHLLGTDLRSAAHLGEKYFDKISGLDGHEDVSKEDLNILKQKFKSGENGFDYAPALPTVTTFGSLG